MHAWRTHGSTATKSTGELRTFILIIIILRIKANGFQSKAAHQAL